MPTEERQCEAWAEVEATSNPPITLRCDKTISQHKGEEEPKHRCKLSVNGGHSWIVHWTGSIASPLAARFRLFNTTELLTLSRLLGDAQAGDEVTDRLWREIDAQLRRQKVV